MSSNQKPFLGRTATGRLPVVCCCKRDHIDGQSKDAGERKLILFPLDGLGSTPYRGEKVIAQRNYGSASVSKRFCVGRYTLQLLCATRHPDAARHLPLTWSTVSGESVAGCRTRAGTCNSGMGFA